MIRISLRAKPEKFRFTTSFKRCYAVTTSTSEDVLIQTLLKQSANNNKPLSCDSTAIVRSAVLKSLARKEYNTVTRAIEMQYEVRNSTTLFRPALHCFDSLHAGMIAYGKLRKPNKSRQLVQRLLIQNEGLSPAAGASTSNSNSTSVITSVSSLSSPQMTASFLLQAYCDADRLDLAEELFLQWLLLSRGNSDNASSSNGSGDSTIALTSKSSISPTSDVSLDAIIQYLTSYRKAMTAPTSTTNPTNGNGITTASFVPSPTAPPLAPTPTAATVIGDSGKETFGISNNDNSSNNNNQYPSTIDMSTLLSSSSCSSSSHNNNIIQNDIPPVIWLTLLRLYADRGNTMIPLNSTY